MSEEKVPSTAPRICDAYAVQNSKATVAFGCVLHQWRRAGMHAKAVKEQEGAGRAHR